MFFLYESLMSFWMRVKFTALSWRLEKVRISIHSLNAKFHTPHWIGKISNNKIRKIRPSPIFSFSVECVSWCWVNRLEWKKKLIKKQKKSQNRRPWYPRMTLKVYSHIWINKMHNVLWKIVAVFVQCSLFRLKEFQVKHVELCRSFFFFYWNAKNFGRNGEKKEYGPR